MSFVRVRHSKTGEILLYSGPMIQQNTIHNLPNLAVSRHHRQGPEDRLAQRDVALDSYPPPSRIRGKPLGEELPGRLLVHTDPGDTRIVSSGEEPPALRLAAEGP